MFREQLTMMPRSLSPVPPNKPQPDHIYNTGTLLMFECALCEEDCAKRWRTSGELYWSHTLSEFVCAEMANEEDLWMDDRKRWSLADERGYRFRMMDTDKLEVGCVYEVVVSDLDGQGRDLKVRKDVPLAFGHASDAKAPLAETARATGMESLVLSISALQAQLDQAKDAIDKRLWHEQDLRVDTDKTLIARVVALESESKEADEALDKLEDRQDGWRRTFGLLEREVAEIKTRLEKVEKLLAGAS